MTDKAEIEILEIRINGFEKWIQGRINACIENPDHRLTAIDCYEDAMRAFIQTFDREAGK